jgi:hypothetical protein
LEKQMSSPRAYSITDWHRDFARAFAAAVPLEASPTQARGALLLAQNDEPEPDEDRDPCPSCKGRGDVWGVIDGEGVTVDCNACDGAGER